MIDKETIVRLAEEQLSHTDCYLVDVAVKPGNLIVVEIDHDQAVGIDDCVALSQYIESRLNRDEDDFELEVGSTGISSPFKIVRQYLKNIGAEVEVLLKDGRKISGVLASANEECVTITVEKKIKPEGEKRKRTISEDEIYTYSEIKYTKNIIRFK
ncbi:MAG: ribosome assembly cofactor RimP [Tannerella sp.]|jgi:ribosome maturation factor RimP|nr:ribosome assembly cofactor RimP [Tannerella sp.]